MSRVPGRLRRRVVERAAGRCEYCQLAQAGQEATFHIDHVVPQSKGGATTLVNLALACVSCSLLKGARSKYRDPESGEVTELFSPRDHRWEEHFDWIGVVVQGRSAIGRATVAALQLNRSRIVEIREEEASLGRHPP